MLDSFISRSVSLVTIKIEYIQLIRQLAKNIKSISVHAVECEVTRSKGHKSTRNIGPINGIFIKLNS